MRLLRGTSNTRTAYFEDGERVYPCRCGETHRGLFGVVKFKEHTCFHEPPLLRFGPEYDYVVCTTCGASWKVETDDPRPAGLSQAEEKPLIACDRADGKIEP